MRTEDYHFFLGRLASRSGKQEMASMTHPEIYRFRYTRTGGMHRTYDVTINLVCRDSGVFAYEAWVHHGGKFKGNGLVFPLVSRTKAQAAAEARARIEDHIENLLGVAE
jgi:hypothetical protein